MTRLTRHYPQPDRFVAGTVGEPGARTFYMQVREGSRLSTVLCEKEQVAVLADHLERILDELSKLLEDGTRVPPKVEVSDDLAPLDQPIEEDFRVGSMSLAWDATQRRVAIELFSIEPDPVAPDDWPGLASEEESGESVDIRITPEQARQFVARSRALVESGRPACPFCLQPINPDGHICPRANGYRRPLFD